jgi:hypothetical protein
MSYLADIISGATSSSQIVWVRLESGTGSQVLIYRGLVLLGSVTLTAAEGQVNLSQPLATGDLIQASVGERGMQSGLPVVVRATNFTVTGWKTPTEVNVSQPDGSVLAMPVDQFRKLNGYQPPSIFDPAGRRTILLPEFTPPDLGEISFDLTIQQQPGQTIVTVNNVTHAQGAPLVRWLASESFGNDMSRSFTQATTLAIDVRGAGDGDFVSRSISVSVLNPSAAPQSTDIVACSYRLFGGPVVKVEVNSEKQCEAWLEGWEADFKMLQFYESDYQEYIWGGPPPGTYKVWVRVAGDTNQDHWKWFTLNKKV